jgi:tetratricopeptide (TPR) repeat protein/tRNA A-37 threonylcarbamoyl transferase component Bud32
MADPVAPKPTWPGQDSAGPGPAAADAPDTSTTLDPTAGPLPPPPPSGPVPEPDWQALATKKMVEAAEPVIPPPPTIPGYEVLGVLGRGGMGVVYKARQASLRRLVALKMILAGGHATAEQRARFRTEAEAAARLQHPNVVQVHEVGEHGGLPFFCLEFVDGGSLANRLDGTPWHPRQAAQLAETLARAVHAAHQRGIVHRDLKPANVLLAEDGTPKVTDFGLAKVLDATAELTGSGAIMGTPSYMAPEQTGRYAHAVGPATDVYSLGAVLYELLTGRPPFKGETPLATVAQVVADEPVPPRSLQPGLPRDLETVCLKCLQKEPQKRYASAEALADDLRHFLDGEPICARPVGPAGRLWRWCRRNPKVASLLAILTVVLTVGTVTATALWLLAEERRRTAEDNLREAKHQQERAEESFRDARRAVDEMLTEVGQERLKGVPEMDPVRRALLEKAAAFYHKFLRERGDDPAVREEAALAYNRAGLINGQLGRLPEAEAAYHKGIALLASLEAQAPHEPRYRQELAQTYFAYLGALHGTNQRYAEAEESMHKGLAILGPLAGEYPRVVEYQEDLADCYNNLGVMYYNTHRLEQAETAHGDALKIRAQLAGARQDTARHQRKVAASHINLGTVYRDSNRLKEAEDSFQKALSISRGLAQEDPDSLDYQHVQGRCHHDLGWLYLHYLGRPSKAESAYGEAVKVYEKLAHGHPAIIDYQSELAHAYEWLAVTYGKLGQSAKAEALSAKVLEIAGPLARLRRDVPRYRDELADAYRHLGWFHLSAGRLEEAESYYDKALPLRKELVEGDDQNVTKYQIALGHLHHERGILYHRQHRFKEAEQAYQEAIRLREKLAKQPPPNAALLEDLAWSYNNLSYTSESLGRPQKADEVRARARDIRKQLVREYPEVLKFSVGLADSYLSEGERLAGSGRPGEALAWYDREIGLLEEVLRQEPAHVEAKKLLCYGHEGRAAALENRGRTREAEKAYGQALEIWQALAAADPEAPAYQGGLAATYSNLGKVLMYRGERSRVALGASTAGLMGSALAQGPLLAASALVPARAEELLRAREMQNQAIDHQQRALRVRPSNTMGRANLGRQYAVLGAIEKRLGNYGEAEKAIRQSRAVRQRLADEFPDEPDYRCEVGGALNDLAIVQKYQSRLAEARRSAEEAITCQQAALKIRREHRLARQFLYNHYYNLADILVQQGEHAEAVRVAAESVRVFPDRGQNQAYAAWFVARCMPLAENDAGLPGEKRKELVQVYADQAMRYLRDGVAKGGVDAGFVMGNLEFEPLRARADYKALLAELEARPKPAPK